MPARNSTHGTARENNRAWLYTLLSFLGASFAFSAFLTYSFVIDAGNLFCEITPGDSGDIILEQGDPETNTGMLSCHVNWPMVALSLLYFVVLQSPITAVFTYGTWRRYAKETSAR